MVRETGDNRKSAAYSAEAPTKKKRASPAALLVLMGALENASDPKAFAHTRETLRLYPLR